MKEIELVIKISEEHFKKICANKEDATIAHDTCRRIANGTPLPKGHGKLIDISKIEEDRIEKDNPIIYLTIDGNYTEAISLDYLNNLPVIIEADMAERG